MQAEIRRYAHTSHEYELALLLRFKILWADRGVGEADYRFLTDPEDPYRLSDRNACHYGAFREGCIVGTVSFEKRGAGEYYLYQFAVDPSTQGKGVGRALLEYAEADLRARGCQRIRLSARRTALGFYQKTGFAVEEDRGGAKLPMRKTLV